jgi:hypothetical protein
LTGEHWFPVQTKLKSDPLHAALARRRNHHSDMILLPAVQVMQVNIAALHTAWAKKHPQQTTSKLSTFLDLSMELAAPYQDLRARDRVDLTEAELFWAVTGESPQTLGEGKLISAWVVWVQAEAAGLKTDSGASLKWLMLFSGYSDRFAGRCHPPDKPTWRKSTQFCTQCNTPLDPLWCHRLRWRAESSRAGIMAL